MSMTPSSEVVVGGMRGKAVGYLRAYQLLRLFEPINQFLKITALYIMTAHNLVAKDQQFAVTHCLRPSPLTSWRWRQDSAARPLSRGLQFCAMHPLGLRKVPKTSTPISPLTNVRHHNATWCHFCWTVFVGKNSFCKICACARCFVQCFVQGFVQGFVQYFRMHCVVKLLIVWF